MGISFSIKLQDSIINIFGKNHQILLHFGLCFRTTGSSKIQKPFFNFVNSTINKELRKVFVSMKRKYENDVLIGEVYWPSIDYCYFIFI